MGRGTAAADSPQSPRRTGRPAAGRLPNRLLSEFNRIQRARELPIAEQPSSLSARQSAVRERYSFAVPSPRALNLIAGYGPIVEVGAGTGYWARLLADRGVDILAYDTAPPAQGGNEWTGKEQFHEVLQADETAAAAHPDRALMLCWPPHNSRMAGRALDAYRGQTVIFIGEPSPGSACADDKFFEALEDQFELDRRCSLPNWPMLHDQVMIWRRRPQS